MTEQEMQSSGSGHRIGMVFGFGLILVGLVLAGFGIKTLYDNWQLFSSGVNATGTVVSYETYIDSDQETRYQAIITFQVGGTTYRHKDPSASGSPRYDINEPVNLLYKPDQPEYVVLNKPLDLWLNPLLPLGGGLFVLLIGFGLTQRRKA